MEEESVDSELRLHFVGGPLAPGGSKRSFKLLVNAADGSVTLTPVSATTEEEVTPGSLAFVNAITLTSEQGDTQVIYQPLESFDEEDEHREQDPADIPTLSELPALLSQKLNSECQHLAAAVRSTLMKSILHFAVLFSGALGHVNEVEHTIDTGVTSPVKQRMYRYSPAQHTEIDG